MQSSCFAVQPVCSVIEMEGCCVCIGILLLLYTVPHSRSHSLLHLHLTPVVVAAAPLLLTHLLL